MNDRTSLALAETLCEHDRDVTRDLPAAPLIAGARRRRTRRRVTLSAAALAAAGLVFGIAVNTIPGRDSSAPVPATHSTEPVEASPTHTMIPPQDDLHAWVESLPETPIPEGGDTLPAASTDGDRMVLSLGGRSVRMPEGVKALTLPRAVKNGWLFVGVTQTRLGLYENTRILHVDVVSMTVREMATGGAIGSLLVSPERDSFAWVDQVSTEPGAYGPAIFHLTRFSDGVAVVSKEYDDRQIGMPATWRDDMITFVRSRFAENGAETNDVADPKWVFDVRRATWTSKPWKRQFEFATPVRTKDGDTDAFVSMKELGGDRACFYRMVGEAVDPEALGCDEWPKVSPGHEFVAFAKGDGTNSGRVLDSATMAPVTVPAQVADMLALCDWEKDSVLLCMPMIADGDTQTHAFRWSVTQGVGQRVDIADLGFHEGDGLAGRIHID